MRKPALIQCSLLLSACLALGAGEVRAQAENPAMYKGPDREQRLIEGARKEGELTLYSSMIVDQAQRPLLDGFMKKYPFIKAQSVRDDPPQQLQKLTAEARAGRMVADVLESTGLEVPARAASIVQPFWSPQAEAYKGRDPDQYWVPSRVSYLGPCYNTNLVKPNEVPKSFEDLLDPKWKGKMAWAGNVYGAMLFITAIRNAMGEEKGLAYLQKLAKQDITSIPSTNRVVVDRVMAGEHAICLDSFLHHPIISAAKGAPVAPLPLDPVLTVASSVMLPKAPPHPHAAMLFIDFLLSQEGQEYLKGANYFPAHPDVPPAKELEKIVPTKIGLRENLIPPPKISTDLAKSRALYQELFSR